MSSMHTHFLPFTKTGWFYLWLVMTISILWANHQGYLSWFESINQQAWSQITPSSAEPTKLIRVIDIQFDRQGIIQITELSKKFPKATFALVGRFPKDFDFIFSELNPELSNKSVFYQLSNASIDSSNESLMIETSALPIQLVNKRFIYPITEVENIRWKTSLLQSYAIQLQRRTHGEQFFWRHMGRLYPSFIAESIIKNSQNQNADQNQYLGINIGLSNYLKINSNQYYFGLSGEVYPNGKLLHAYGYEDLTTANADQFSGIILIDDLSNKRSDQIARALANVIDKEYLVSNWLTKLSEVLLIIILLVMIAWSINRSKKIVFTLFLASLISVLVIQWLFISLKLWMPLHLLFIIAFGSILIRTAYKRELSIFIDNNNEKNNWLNESIGVFYQTQNFEKLLPLIENSYPDNALLERVFDIAIDAESESNETLAKRLYGWILQHDRKHSATLDRMKELSPVDTVIIDDDGDSDLEQTMVIDPSGKNANQPVASILKVEYFGRYKVDGILGKGAMGIVFQGVDPKINRHVAIKTLQLNDELDGEVLEETKERFFREAETAGNLSHANIVTIYDVGEERQNNSHQTLGYIAMDLLTGEPLSEHIKEGKLLPAQLIYQLMIQLTDALDYAHRQKVIHRDIKPANIIYDDDLQRGTLTDFGIACLTDHSKTKTGMIMGSPYYMSPEQVIGLKVDGRSDIFSLGVTFYQLLSGHLPFSGESIASVAFHITKTKHESVRYWNKKLPTSAARITNKALQKDVNKRYQTMAEFKQALINALKRDYNKLPLI